MENLNRLFSIKKSSSDIAINTDLRQSIEVDEVQIRANYYQTGFGASQTAQGEPLVFRACLQRVYASFEDQCRKLEIEQDKLKQPFIEEKQRQESELKNCETALSINNDKLKTVNSAINQIKQDIEMVKSNPEIFDITTTKQPHALFYIGLLLLIPITVYLFVFYISASYSAFFKVFSDDALSSAIFDAQSLTNAMKEGILEGILILTIPTVFLGLGYIIHMVQKGKGFKNLIRVSALILMTFLFDGLLAYQIEKKIYEFNKTMESPPYNLNVAVAEAEFWMIIFAGFVVYIIWGLVFDLVMKEFENIDKIKGFIRNKKQELLTLEETKAKVIADSADIQQKASTIRGKVEELQCKIDGFILNVRQYLLYHSQYKEGWFQAISQALNFHPDVRQRLTKECEEIAHEHLVSLNLAQSDHQQIIYSRVS